jgi:hypothetical protein
LAAATTTACVLAARTHGLLPFSPAAGWALLGAAIGAEIASAPLLAATAATGLTALIAVTVVGRRRAARTAVV